MNYAKRHGLVRRPGERLLDPGLQHLAAIDHRLDIRDGAERWVLTQILPVAVIGDKTRLVFRHLLVEQLLHGQRQSLKHLALLSCSNLLENINIVGMDREKPNELVHPLVHVAVELGERREVFADFGLLLAALLEQALGDDKLHVLAGNEDLFESVLDPAKSLLDKLKLWIVKKHLLNARHEAETQVFANFTDFSHEVEIKDYVAASTEHPVTQIVQQLVHNQE